MTMGFSTENQIGVLIVKLKSDAEYLTTDPNAKALRMEAANTLRVLLTANKAQGDEIEHLTAERDAALKRAEHAESVIVDAHHAMQSLHYELYAPMLEKHNVGPMIATVISILSRDANAIVRNAAPTPPPADTDAGDAETPALPTDAMPWDDVHDLLRYATNGHQNAQSHIGMIEDNRTACALEQYGYAIHNIIEAIKKMQKGERTS
jgi:hypothetical protein